MRTRPVLAILCCLLGAGPMFLAASSARHGDRQLFFSLAGVVLAAGVLLALRPVWAGLAGRGLLWTTLAMTTLLGSIDRPVWTTTATALAMCAALIVLGRPARGGSTAAFQPDHHGGPLTLALVLGFADVATLAVWSMLAFASDGMQALPYALVFTAFAAAVAVSLVGLYRLYAWGFLLNLGVNLVAVILMALDVFHLHVVRMVFIVPAVAQILIALPVLVAIIRRRPLALPAPLARLAAFVPALAVVIMAGLNVQPWFGPSALRTLARWGMYHL
ncbi:MAG: hypothetical protein ABIY55_17990 [Kofleriaceae bacterium]